MAQTESNAHLSEGVVAVYRAWMDRVAPDEVLALARKYPVLSRGGLQARKANLAEFRKRLRQQFRAGRRCPEDLQPLLRRSGRHFLALDGLEAAYLEQVLPELCGVFGLDFMEAALRLDERESVRAQAHTLPEPMEREAAAAWLQAEWGGLADRVVSGATPAAGPATSEEQRKLQAQLEERVRRMQVENERIGSKARKKQEVLRAEADRDRRAVAEIRTQAEQLRRERDEGVAARRRAERDLAALRERAELELARRVEERMRSEVHSWLDPARRAEAAARALEAAGPGGLEERARDLIRRQAEVDRQAGTRRILRERCGLLEGLRDQLLAARREALHPLPEHESLGGELAREIRRLQDLLGDVAGDQPVVAEMLRRLNEAQAPDELRALYELIGNLEAEAMLPPPALRRLYQKFRTCMQRVYDPYQPQVVALPEARDAGSHVRRALDAERPLFWVLDGHNVLFGLGERYRGAYEDGAPKQKARQALVRDLAALTAGKSGLHTRLVFDGPEASEKVHSPQFREIYSGGTGDHRADGVLVRLLKESKKDFSAIDRVAVTNDRALSDRCRSAGAQVLRLRELDIILDENLPAPAPPA